ncbi:hypothetical protein PPERSA_12370 [Pseudocohnilembus persalinus]|uniref:very-long-chain (3R)-3-hydroxyacyl-CoA dehydratase n=1 Tax=Pseudocohnilembus persalinus TaxID=266149 RepID=A0A0V0R8D2_PSEPJ|nr:hypothetical protein PPERSA_12370 [Pseudocohnilembus persalinus]|eukprot:KRX10749.1 hypothetical protein PPERSA_12370 [Pseudocohnilembus persalinus]
MSPFIDFAFTRGNILFTFIQLLGKNLVAQVFLCQITTPYAFITLSLAWAVSDMIRFSFQVFRASHLEIAGSIRYNAFWVLYPLGGIHEFIVIQQWADNHKEQDFLYYISIANRALLFVMLPVMYVYMIKQRKKFYKSIQERKQKFQ